MGLSSKDLSQRMSRRLANFKLGDDAIAKLADRVIIDGLVRAMPGAKVSPQDGTIHYDTAADGQG